MRVRRHTRGPRAELDQPPAPATETEAPAAPREERRRRGRWARDLGLLTLGLAGVFAIGYTVSAVWLSPAPLVTDDHSVPRVLELGPTAARERLTELGFRVRVEGSQPSPTTPRGGVVWQDPVDGTIAPEGTLVTLILSAGPSPVPVPDLAGMPTPLAQTFLTAAGLRLGEVDSVIAGDDRGVVLTTRPSVGTLRDPGSTVDLVVSTGRSLR